MSVKLCLFEYSEVDDLVTYTGSWYSHYSGVSWNFDDNRWNAKDISGAKKLKLVSILKKHYEEVDKETAIKK